MFTLVRFLGVMSQLPLLESLKICFCKTFEITVLQPISSSRTGEISLFSWSALTESYTSIPSEFVVVLKVL